MKDWAAEFDKLRKRVQLRRQSGGIFDHGEVSIIPINSSIKSIHPLDIENSARQSQLASLLLNLN